MVNVNAVTSGHWSHGPPPCGGKGPGYGPSASPLRLYSSPRLQPPAGGPVLRQVEHAAGQEERQVGGGVGGGVVGGQALIGRGVADQQRLLPQEGLDAPLLPQEGPAARGKFEITSSSPSPSPSSSSLSLCVRGVSWVCWRVFFHCTQCEYD